MFSNGGVDRRSKNGLDSSYLGMHVCYLFMEDGNGFDEMALRRSEGLFWCCLDGRDKECCCCFSQFGRDLQETASYRSGNADPGLAICKRFARNSALSNGFQGTPIEGFPTFY